jgi:site-specific DNA-cytosine methylase
MRPRCAGQIAIDDPETPDPDGPMRVLVACEYSGTVRDAFIAQGHNAMSCDLLPSETPGPHYQGDVRDILNDEWDLMIAHPPCTHLAVSGARWWADKQQEQQEALDFIRALMAVNIPRWAIENPVSLISSALRPPDQIIQPWQYGHGETKTTCLWTRGLPALRPTTIVPGREARIHRMPPSEDRWKERSRTYPGIAHAMATQWGQIKKAAAA